MCVQLSLSKDGKALRKFLHFDIKLNTLRENKTGKALTLFIDCCTEFEDKKYHAFTAHSDAGFAIIYEYRSPGMKKPVLIREKNKNGKEKSLFQR